MMTLLVRVLFELYFSQILTIVIVIAGIEASLHDIDGPSLDFTLLPSPLTQVDPKQNTESTVPPHLAIPAVLVEASISTQPSIFISGAASG